MGHSRIIKSAYVTGSGGRVNLFFREKGHQYTYHMCDEECTAIQPCDQWIIQWTGTQDYDSGYSKDIYSSREAALAGWKCHTQMQMGVDIINTDRLGWTATKVFSLTKGD